ncbi:MAG TPA: winged helix-turn-helix domain-containing protein [Terriglobales bacterium]|jgi:TolB-like protein/DNA-binding winged helix-turn-helix (wHTH) protein/Tfp pilus assembly protein PilF|nr:winged helix-turn-helix domain-containing protein [Terriglobales bacterium]
MEAPAGSRRRLRSGLFEVDLGSGEVHKGGRKIRLQEQPFRVLALLLEHPGEVITREELQAKVWPADTFVGFDEGINTAIRKLRVAFGDSADNPRFIETIPRRGYRFVAPVHEAAAEPAQLAENIAVENAPVDLPLVRRRSFQRSVVALSVAALLVLLASLTYLRRSHPSVNSAVQKRVMLAILPFQNMSNDPRQEYFSDGLTEETITDLGQLSPEHLGVIARTSAMSYKHTNKTVSQIGHELGVDYVLEGSVRREGGQARISAQLIRVSDQTHLWAQNYERELNDLLEIENELGKAIARQVQVNLTPQQETDLSKMRTVNPDAYDLYLQGRFYWNQRNPAAIKESIAYLQQATVQDPNFALAYVGLADAYNIGNILGAYSPKNSLPKAKEAATKALALDPSLAEAHAALGMVKSHYEFDLPGAQREFLKAIELNPNSAYAHLFYSNCYLSPMGRMSEAIAENQRALELDPLSLPINNFMGMTYMFAENYEKAYQQFQHTIAMDPTFPLAHQYFSWLLVTMGRFEESIKENQKSELLSGSSPEDAAAEAAMMLQAFKTGGEKGFYQKNLEQTLQTLKQSGGESADPTGVASAYALVGDKDRAFKWLDKAYAERDGQDIMLLKCVPPFKSLHGDPRFTDLLRRLGLPE